ncbi:hypothetical protein BHM03_00026175 [Ensete ventricosum]|uniref:Uncharacterized protein n=1 Tax=Ensete ventricosum TaxID=4639 RepID=A0A445MHC9_ENSVE|nr:hypothetical protein BHM03_00026175 [Ensete ventricosum]
MTPVGRPFAGRNYRLQGWSLAGAPAWAMPMEVLSTGAAPVAKATAPTPWQASYRWARANHHLHRGGGAVRVREEV